MQETIHFRFVGVYSDSLTSHKPSSMDRIFDLPPPPATCASAPAGLKRTLSMISDLEPRTTNTTTTAAYSSPTSGLRRAPSTTGASRAIEAVGSHESKGAAVAAQADLCSLYLDKKPCIMPLTAAVRLAPQTRECEWVSDNEIVQQLFSEDLNAAYKWMSENKNMQVAIADASDIHEKYPALMGTTDNMPSLRPRSEFCCLYRLSIRELWTSMGVRAKNCIQTAKARGGSHDSQAFYLEGPMSIYDVPGKPTTARFDMGNGRIALMTGIPLPPGPELRRHIRESIEVHKNHASCDFNSETCSVQLLPTQVMGGTESTHVMGLDGLIGSHTTDGSWSIVAASGTYAVRVDLDGISAETIALCVQRWRSISRDAPGNYMFHDENGNQYLLLTIIKDGVTEVSIGMGNDSHMVEEQ